MNRRSLIALCVVPVVLMGAVIWARHKAWQKLEEDFRQQIISSASRSSLRVSLVNERRNRLISLGEYQLNELENFLSNVHLEGNNEGGLHSENSFRCDVEPTASSGGIGLVLGVEQDEGVIVESFDPTIRGYRWKELRISTESCRILKKRLQVKFGHNPRGSTLAPP